MQQLIIYGASYPDTLNLLDDINEEQPTWDVLGFVDDVVTDACFSGYPILGTRDCLGEFNYRSCFILNNVFSRPSARRVVAEVIGSHGKISPSLIHPSVRVRRTSLGNGVVIMDGVKVGAGTTIGDYVAVRYNAIINHDNCIGSYAFIGPGVTLCGHVQVGSSAYIGAGSTVRERIRIGDQAMVGMGSIVVRDVDANCTVYGNPASLRSK